MPSSNFFPPSLESNLLSAPELKKISKALKKLRGAFLLKTVIGFCVALFFIQYTKHQHEPEYLVGQFGLIKGLIIAMAVMAIPVVWVYFSSWRNLKKDLKEKAKVSRQTAVELKERSLLSNRIYARIDPGTSGFQEFEIESDLFEKLEQGQVVRLEFTPNSKCLLKVELQENAV